MSYLRTVSTRRLLAMIATLVVVLGAGTTIALAASSGPVPAPTTLPAALHAAATAPKPAGVTAQVTFTDNLLSAANLGGISSPLINGATGRLWADGRNLRLELQADSGDSELLLTGNSFWLSDPSSNTVYEGKLPPHAAKPPSAHRYRDSAHGVPTVAQIQRQLQRAAGRVTITGPVPTDVGGQPAYSVTVAPHSSAGLLGSVQVAWDSVYGVPLNLAIFARGDSTPQLQLQADSVSYGPVSRSVFAISPPAGAKVVHVALPRQWQAGSTRGARARLKGALRRFGHGLSSIFVLKHQAARAAAAKRVIATELGTLIELTRGGSSYIVAGSVKPPAAEAVANSL